MKIQVHNDPAWPRWRRLLRSSSLSLEVQGAIVLMKLLTWVLIVAALAVVLVLAVQRAADHQPPQKITVYYEDTPDR